MKRIAELLVASLLVFALTFLQSCGKDEPEFKDYYLKSQKDVDNFNLSTVNGNIHINGEYISTLSNLNKIKAIKGSLSIYRSHLLKNLDGLHYLSSIDSGLYIQNNSSLESINHLTKLEYVGGDILIFENESIKNLLGLGSLIGFTNEIQITRNMTLESLEGLEMFSGSKLTINGNSSLANLSALSDIKELKSLYISDQNIITSLEGLENLCFIEDYLVISSNASLMSIKELSDLTSVAIIDIDDNKMLETLDGLENISTGLKSIRIFMNSSLTDFCALVPVIDSNNLDYISVKQNKYNPTHEDIQDGDCKP
ncbi:MAG: hypothetical protein ACLFNU_12575 [Bacteroidales bacterium]